MSPVRLVCEDTLRAEFYRRTDLTALTFLADTDCGAALSKKAVPVQKIKGINNEIMVPVDSKPSEINACGHNAQDLLWSFRNVKNAKDEQLK